MVVVATNTPKKCPLVLITVSYIYLQRIEDRIFAPLTMLSFIHYALEM